MNHERLLKHLALAVMHCVVGVLCFLAEPGWLVIGLINFFAAGIWLADLRFKIL